MAVSEQTPYKEYTANGSANSFALEFDCDNQDHLIVLVDDVEPVVGTWSLIGGAVVFSTAPEKDKKITIQRNTPFRRDGDFQSYDNSFRPGSVNKGFDWVWLKLQELGLIDDLQKVYFDNLHVQQQRDIDQKTGVLQNRINTLENSTNQADQQLQSNINDLKYYSDNRNDILKKELLDILSKHDIHLDNIDGSIDQIWNRVSLLGSSSILGGKLYASTADGLSKTKDGEFFNVVGSDDNTFAALYKNVGGTVVPQGKSYPNAGYVAEAYNQIEDNARINLLKFIPRNLHATIRDGTITEDLSPYINYAMTQFNGGDLIIPRGTSPIGQTINQLRGWRLLGEGPFDTRSGASSQIKLLNGSNCTMLKTPAALSGDPTHYMALENLLFECNKMNQTLENAAIQFHGAWIGSWIKSLFIKDNLGSAITFDKGADIEIDHLWINGTTTENGYALDTNASYVGTEARQGMLNFDHLYVENTSRDKNDGSPKTTPSNRGNAINFGYLTTLTVKELHLEACARMVDLDKSQTVQLGKISCAHVGRDDIKDSAIVRLKSAGTASLSVGTAVITTNSVGDIYGVRKATGYSSNIYLDAPLSGSPKTMVGYDFAMSTDAVKLSQPIAVRNNVTILGTDSKVKLNTSTVIGGLNYGGVKATSNGVGLYSTLNQESNNELILLDVVTPINSLGNAVRAHAPIQLVDERVGPNNLIAGSLTKYSSSEGKGVAYSLETSSVNFLASIVSSTEAPLVKPNHVGQLFVDKINKKCYVAMGLLVEDWVLLN